MKFECNSFSNSSHTIEVHSLPNRTYIWNYLCWCWNNCAISIDIGTVCSLSRSCFIKRKFICIVIIFEFIRLLLTLPNFTSFYLANHFIHIYIWRTDDDVNIIYYRRRNSQKFLLENTLAKLSIDKF